MVSGPITSWQIDGETTETVTDFIFLCSKITADGDCSQKIIKNPPANAGDIGEASLIPWIGKIPWMRAWQPTPVFLPGESHEQSSLAGYSPWGHEDLNMTVVT